MEQVQQNERSADVMDQLIEKQIKLMAKIDAKLATLIFLVIVGIISIIWGTNRIVNLMSEMRVY